MAGLGSALGTAAGAGGADASGAGVAIGLGVMMALGAGVGAGGTPLASRGGAATPTAPGVARKTGARTGWVALGVGVGVGVGSIRLNVGVALGVGTIEGLGAARGRAAGMLKLSSPGIVCGAAVFA